MLVRIPGNFLQEQTLQPPTRLNTRLFVTELMEGQLPKDMQVEEQGEGGCSQWVSTSLNVNKNSVLAEWPHLINETFNLFRI